VLVFKITNPGAFIYKLGATNFDEFLSGTVDEAIRVMVRKETHRTVYGLRGAECGAPMCAQLNEKFGKNGVLFESVKVVGVWLPDQLANALEITTKMREGMEKLRTAAEFEALQIKLSSEMEIEEIKRRQEQVLVQESGRKRRAEIEFENRSVKAEEDGSVAKIKAEGKVEVDRVVADADLKRTMQKLSTFKLTQVAQAEAAANTVKIKADFAEEEEVIKAGYQEEQMMCDAMVTKALASVEMEGIKNLEKKREHEVLLQEKGILTKLAASGRFNLIGSPGDRLVNAVLKGSFLDTTGQEKA
jgi:regulator of protease activity HflC (stomatin/prohibitin superfamily)